SGSGKSTLVNDILFPGVQRRIVRNNGGNFRTLDGLSGINKVIRVDQAPIGHNPSSTPATYTGVFDLIRQLYSQLPQARARGFTPRQFSFNVPGGRCEKCEGFGQLRIEMHFLPDVWVTCDSCQGKRFTEDTLSVKYHEFSIHDMLEMQIGKALEVLSNIPKIRRVLQTLVDVGLDYVSLGQPATTLSGGEAQRVKLAAELARPDTGNTLYLLDEPTTGLHFGDVAKLLTVLHRLVDLGNTVIVIEHNLDVIKSADWVIDMGPEAGAGGGQIVVAGTPEQVVEHARLERAASAAVADRDLEIADDSVAVAASRQAGDVLVVRKAKPKRKVRAVSKVGRGLAVDSARAGDAALNDSAHNDRRRLRSYTGEALAESLAAGPYAIREAFDPVAYHAEMIGDVDLEKIGRDTLLPWQSDGRRWHTVDIVDRKGNPVRWDRASLVRVIEAIEKRGGFSEVNWNNRSIVEVTSPVKSKGWFLHAITGETWLLKLKFRVPRRSFTKQQLESVLDLPTLNQLDDIESYSNEPRIRARQAGAWMELEIRPFQLAEIDKPSFWSWLDQAMTAFLELTSDEASSTSSLDVEALMPWKVLGQRWHMLRKGFPAGREIVWPAETLSVLVQSVHQTGATGRWRWDEKTTAKFMLSGRDEPWITLHTKRPEGLIVMLDGPTLADRDDLIAAMPVPVNWASRGEGEQLQMALVETQQPRDPAFRRLLQAHYKAVSR
ncbi:MAG: hypothetical protein ACTHOU_00835, partial [Aureliella sp.]